MRFAHARLAIGATAIALGPASAGSEGFNVTLRSHVFVAPCSDISARGDYVYLGRHSGGCDIFDVSDPDNPVFVSNWVHPTFEIRTWDLRPLGDDLLLVSNEDDAGFGTIVLDVSTPSAPVMLTELGEPTFPPLVHNIWPDPDGVHAYLSGYGGDQGTYIVNLTDPLAPTVDAAVLGEIHDSHIQDDLLYIAGGFEATSVYDVTDRTAPSPLVYFSPNTPDTLFYQHNVVPVRDTDYIVVTEEIQLPTDGFFYDQGSMRGYDISDPGNPVEVWRWKSENMQTDSDITPHNAYVVGDYLYLSCYQDGLKVFDITDPTDPVEVAFYDTFPDEPEGLFEGNWGVWPYAGNDRIYLSDWQNGLFVVNFNGARKSTITGQVLDAVTLDPIPGAVVRSVTANRTKPSDAGGAYELATGSGTHDFEVSAEDYQLLEETLALVDDGSLDHDFLLQPLTVSVGEAPVAQVARLVGAAPNPFNPRTAVRYEVPTHAAGLPLSLTVYDVGGREVRELVAGPAAPGIFTSTWDGRDDQGADVASGVYVVRLTVGETRDAERLTLMK
jgi:choice-of-anchor B domain-containing protein